MSGTRGSARPDARKVAVDALVRIDRDQAYANLLLPKLLARSGLGERDRAFATQLVYGTVRHRRACDWFIDRFAVGDLDPEVRAALRVGTYQLRFLSTPAHAAVSATVDTVPRRARGLVNAVLRRVSEADDAWPSDAVRLSYPDWIVERLTAGSGELQLRVRVRNGDAGRRGAHRGQAHFEPDGPGGAQTQEPTESGFGEQT